MTPTLSDLKALDAKATKATKCNWHIPFSGFYVDNTAFIVACVAYVRAELAKAEGE
jgi:hypothetical protein